MSTAYENKQVKWHSTLGRVVDLWNQSKNSVCIKQRTTRHGCCPEKIQ
uniref:Uncharacterized protein n=1 Tax=Arundo donax TaxID=35708 RepID=A0A0A9CKV8_ARUDO